MAIKKYTSGVWVPITYHKYGTETETITSLPAQIIGDGQAITSCQISGNTVQGGIPTPDYPVDVVGCGVRTSQLFEDKIVRCNIDASGRLVQTSSFSVYIAKVEQGVTYTASAQITGGFFIAKPTLGSTSYDGQRLVYVPPKITAPITGYMVFRADIGSDEPMFNLGTAPLPYEPYGYKLPPTVNGAEYPIYLGNAQTTRKIKKLVLTGNEAWNSYGSCASGVGAILLLSDMLPNSRKNGFCTHFTPQISPANSAIDGVTFGASNTSLYITFSVDTVTALNLTNIGRVKAWLAAQYAKGTPVTIWYVLAEPETAVVNEPLHKIGNYADTISATNIPTTGTPENFDVGTTLKPSEVQLTYHGWHEHDDTKYTQGE